MSKKSRDFYHIQDQLFLAWRYASGSKGVCNPQIEALSREIDDLGRKLIVSNPELSEYIELSAKKIALLEKIPKIRVILFSKERLLSLELLRVQCN